MSLIAAVLCCHRDEHLLDEFLANWRCRSDVKLVLLSDVADPVQDVRGLHTYNLQWCRSGPIAPGVVGSLLAAGICNNATEVLKLDVDVVHNDTGWVKSFFATDLLGFQRQGEGHAYGGAARYSMRALETLNEFDGWSKFPNQEDVAVWAAANELGLETHALDSSLVAGADDGAFESPEKYSGFKWVHCGQFGKDRAGREKTHRAMIALNNSRGNVSVRPTLGSGGHDLSKIFDKVGVLNLDSRPERYQAFQRRCALAELTGIERVRAVHGDTCPHPDFWRSGNGAWGCLMSHVRFAQDALMSGAESFLVFEDDVVFSDDFGVRLQRVMENLEGFEWDMLYLGGQHLYVETSPPWPYAEGLVRCNNVNRTHAFAVHRHFMVEYLKHITDFKGMMENYVPPSEGVNEWFPHIDHWLGKIHRQKITLAVDPWICGQAAGVSGVNGGDQDENWWHDKGWGK